jgi:flagellar motor switch protein FliM
VSNSDTDGQAPDEVQEQPGAAPEAGGESGGNPAREAPEGQSTQASDEDTGAEDAQASADGAEPATDTGAEQPQADAEDAEAEQSDAQPTDGDDDSAAVQPEDSAVEADAAPDIEDRRRGDRRQRERRVRTLDFSQPTKFNAELRRRIVRALTPFCEAFAIRLSTELRTSVELTIADPHQLTWSAAKAKLPADSIAASLKVAPIERKMLLNIDLPIVLRALECLLGGSPSQAPSERRLSEVDWALARPLLEAMAAQMATAWRDLGGLQLTLGEIDVEGDAGVSAPLGEPTFAVPIEVRIDGLASTMSLFVPWSAVAPVAEHILGQGSHLEDADPTDGLAVHRGLAVAHVLLRAEVGSTSMPVEQMLTLAPGSLLELEDRADTGVQVFAERVPLGRAHPGLRGTRRAIKLITPLEPGRAPMMPAASTPQAGRSALIGAGQATDSDFEPAVHPQTNGGGAALSNGGLARMLRVPVRVWAELGRMTLPLGSALDLPLGTVLELEQEAEAPLELFANGKSFAFGALQVSGDGKWVVEIQALA